MYFTRLPVFLQKDTLHFQPMDNLDFIYSSLVADKMSREKWGGCGCSPAWFALAVILYLGGYGSYKVYKWAEDMMLGVAIYDEKASFEVIAVRIVIICLIVIFWVLLFVLLWKLAGKEEKKK